jgi:cytochrome P450
MGNNFLVDVYSQEFKQNAFELYGKMRDEAPASLVTLSSGMPCWFVTGYESVRKLFVDSRLSKNSKNAGGMWHIHHPNYDGESSKPIFNHLLTMDRPDHSRLRRSVAHAFSQEAISEMRETVIAIAEEAALGLAPNRPIEIVSALSSPFPLKIISELLGIPIEDRGKFYDWSRKLMSASADEQGQILIAGAELRAYLEDFIAQQRATPGNGLFARLSHASESNGITDDELVSMGFILLVAGHETSSGLITSGIRVLAHNVEWWDRAREHPNQISTLVDELLRLCSPVDLATPRFALEDIILGEQTIRRGDAVFLGVLASNWDPCAFEQPHKFDPDRDFTLVKHIAFGHGAHKCLGEHLARLEAEILFYALTRRFSSLRIVQDQDGPWTPGLLMRALQALQVEFSE